MRNRILFVLTFLVMALSYCYGQEPAVPVHNEKVTFEGKYMSIYFPDLYTPDDIKNIVKQIENDENRKS